MYVRDFNGGSPHSGNNFARIISSIRATVTYLSEIKYFAHNRAFWVCHWQRGQMERVGNRFPNPCQLGRYISWRGSSCSFQKRRVQGGAGGREEEGNVSRRVRGRKEGTEREKKRKRDSREIGRNKKFTYLCDKYSRQVRREPVAVSAQARTGSQPPCSGRSPPSAACPDARLSRFRPSVCLQRPNGEIDIFNRLYN